jgi:hypothetical protein
MFDSSFAYVSLESGLSEVRRQLINSSSFGWSFNSTNLQSRTAQKGVIDHYGSLDES